MLVTTDVGSGFLWLILIIIGLTVIATLKTKSKIDKAYEKSRRELEERKERERILKRRKEGYWNS